MVMASQHVHTWGQRHNEAGAHTTRTLIHILRNVRIVGESYCTLVHMPPGWSSFAFYHVSLFATPVENVRNGIQKIACEWTNELCISFELILFYLQNLHCEFSTFLCKHLSSFLFQHFHSMVGWMHSLHFFGSLRSFLAVPVASLFCTSGFFCVLPSTMHLFIICLLRLLRHNVGCTFATRLCILMCINMVRAVAVARLPLAPAFFKQ